MHKLTTVSFQDDASSLTRWCIGIGFCGALVHIIVWLAPETVSPAITGTGLTKVVMGAVLHFTATIITAAGAMELWQAKGRPKISDKFTMAIGATMSVAAGAIHFLTVMNGTTEMRTMEWIAYAGNLLAITGALLAAWAIGQFAEHP